MLLSPCRARLPALYSDFRSQRSLNPDGFQANVAAWRDGLSHAAWEGQFSTSTPDPDLLTISVDKRLLRGLEHKQFGQPLALGAVVKHAVSGKDFVPLGEFLSAVDSIYAKPWTSLPKIILSWALQQVWADAGAREEDILPQGRFVVLKNVEKAASALAEHSSSAASLLDRAYTKHHFHKTFSETLVEGKRLSERDMEVLLKYASRDKGLLSYDGKTIKLESPDSKEGAHGVTEEVAAMASIKELIDDLRSQTGLMEKRVEDLTVKAKEHVARKNRVSALALLKSKKLTEASLEKRHATLSQLEQVADKLQVASDQVQLVKVMESSTVVLQNLNKQVGGVERVEQTIDSLREQMGEVDEVGNVLATAGSDAIIVDEMDIDDELAELEAAERLKSEEAKAAAEAAKEAQEAERLKQQLDEIPKLAEEVGDHPLSNNSVDKASEEAAQHMAEELGKLSLK
jgi:charged multivesicular body protein 7